MKKVMAISALALLLAACGGSGSDSSSDSGTGTGTPPVAMTDAFFAMVSAIVGTSSDTTEPVAVEGTTATTPENTEPAAV